MATIYSYSSNNNYMTYTLTMTRSGTTVTLKCEGTIYNVSGSSHTSSSAKMYVQLRYGVSPTNTSGTTTYVSSYGTLLNWTSSTVVDGYSGSTNTICKIADNNDSNFPNINSTGFPSGGRSFTITWTTTNGAAVSLSNIAVFVFRSQTSTSAPTSSTTKVLTFIGKKDSSLSGNKVRYYTQSLSVAAATYTVSYNKGSNGTGTNTTDTKTYDVALTLKGAIFTRAGYYQSGWATSDGGAQAYELSASYTSNAATTLYPVWTAYKVTIKFHVNGGSIATGTGTTRYRVGSDNLVERSTDSGSTWADMTNTTQTGDTYKNLTNVDTMGITKAGYYITGTSAYRVGSTSGTLINQDTTSASSTNPATIATLTGSSSALTSNVTVTLYVNWQAYTATIKFHVNGGSITTGTGTTRYRVGSDNIVERSTDSGSTWADLTNTISTGTSYVNLYNVSTYGATKNGYNIAGDSAYRAGSTSGTLINQDTSSASSTNAATIANLTGSATLTANVTVTLYINWQLSGFIKMYINNEWVLVPVKLRSNSSWVTVTDKIKTYKSNTWKPS